MNKYLAAPCLTPNIQDTKAIFIAHFFEEL